jgi:hypothetical protein
MYDSGGMSTEPWTYPASGPSWISMYYQLGKSSYSLVDLFPRDGYPGGYGGIADDPYYDVPAGIKMWPNAVSATLPLGDLFTMSAVATPGDYVVGAGWVDGEDYAFGAYGDPLDPLSGAVYTDTLPVFGADYMSYAPAHVDLNGDGNYDQGMLWLSDQSTPQPDIYLYDPLEGNYVMSMTAPASGYSDWQIGSFPGGVTIAGDGADDFYTYLFDPPSTPMDGYWRTVECGYSVTRLGYTTTREIIPEPVMAIVVYMCAGLLLGGLILRRR